MPLTMTTPKPIIFTDLDGTLLDRDTYSFEAALPALHLIKQKGIPLILTSSKTRAEMEYYKKQLEINHPFISENGGAVFVPKDYFSFPFPHDREAGEYFVLELGSSHPRVREVLHAVQKETGISIKGFSDLTQEQLSALCRLSPEEAALAQIREYDEPFIVEGGKDEIGLTKRKIEEKGMNCVLGGRFLHILGENDKGKAVEILKELYGFQFFSILTLGIGDSPNDFPLLQKVDHRILLREKEEPFPSFQNLITINGTGPCAWNEALLSLITKLDI